MLFLGLLQNFLFVGDRWFCVIGSCCGSPNQGHVQGEQGEWGIISTLLQYHMLGLSVQDIHLIIVCVPHFGLLPFSPLTSEMPISRLPASSLAPAEDNGVSITQEL